MKAAGSVSRTPAFVVRNVTRLTNWTGLEEISYAIRLDRLEQVPDMNFWQTIYPFIASDVTFPGSIVVIFLVG